MAAPSGSTCPRMDTCPPTESSVQDNLARIADSELTILKSLPAEVQTFLSLHPSLNVIFLISPEKVRCNLTGHEMPCSMAVMEAYTSGRKYQRLHHQTTFDWDEHLPHIVPSTKKGHRHQLFCKLTMRHICRVPVDVQTHIKGRRYKRAVARYDECQREGIPYKALCRVPLKDKGKRDMDQEPSQTNNTDSDTSQESSDDSMSDLYPAADFEDVGDRMQTDIGEASDMKEGKPATSAVRKQKNAAVSKKGTTKKSRKNWSKDP